MSNTRPLNRQLLPFHLAVDNPTTRPAPPVAKYGTSGVSLNGHYEIAENDNVPVTAVETNVLTLQQPWSSVDVALSGNVLNGTGMVRVRVYAINGQTKTLVAQGVSTLSAGISQPVARARANAATFFEITIQGLLSSGGGGARFHGVSVVAAASDMQGAEPRRGDGAFLVYAAAAPSNFSALPFYFPDTRLVAVNAQALPAHTGFVYLQIHDLAGVVPANHVPVLEFQYSNDGASNANGPDVDINYEAQSICPTLGMQFAVSTAQGKFTDAGAGRLITQILVR